MQQKQTQKGRESVMKPIEQFSSECRKTKNKVITLANHKGNRAMQCAIKRTQFYSETEEKKHEEVTIGLVLLSIVEKLVCIP